MAGLTDPIVLTMVLYFAGTILVAWWFGRGAGSGYVSFTLAGKNLDLLPFTTTHFATFVGEPALFGEGPLESAVPATVAALVTIIGVSYALPGGETFTIREIHTAATRDMTRFAGGDVAVADGGTESGSGDD